jgi:hypothetical protein
MALEFLYTNDFQEGLDEKNIWSQEEGSFRKLETIAQGALCVVVLSYNRGLFNDAVSNSDHILVCVCVYIYSRTWL